MGMANDFQAVAAVHRPDVEEGRVDGAGIAISVDGRSRTSTYLAGEASPGRPATADTLWPLASISKLYTASAVMSLIEKGMLALWTRASAVFPEFRGGGREEITLRHLLTHTSGLAFAPADIAELLQATGDRGGADRPWVYRSAAFSAGDGPVVFRHRLWDRGVDGGEGGRGFVSGVDSQRVLEAAGLTRPMCRFPPSCIPRVARVAGATGEGTDWAIYSSLYGSQIGHPAYGVVATVADVLRFLLLFDPHGANTIHSAAGLRAMTTNQTGGFRSEAAAYPIAKWAAGFALQEGNGDAGIASEESYGHLGGTGCVGWVDPRYGVTVAFVSNGHGNRGLDEWRERLEEAVNVSVAAATAPAQRATPC